MLDFSKGPFVWAKFEEGDIPSWYVPAIDIVLTKETINKPILPVIYGRHRKVKED